MLEVKVIKNQLPNFKEKMQRLQTLDTGEIQTLIATEGKRYAEELYAGSSKGITVVTGRKSKTVSYVAAVGEAVAYDEYGTGIEGEGTYDGKLPTSGVPITGKWTYYYDSESKATVNGRRGWMLGKSFVVGQPARARMWKTRNYLILRKKLIARRYIMGKVGVKNV